MRKKDLDREMAEEMRFHLAQRTEENEAAGLPPEAAQLAARRKFGNVGSLAERGRDARGLPWLDQLLADARQGARALVRRDRGFGVAALLLIALGIGTTTAAFSVAESVLWRPLPYAEPERLVALWTNEVRLSAPRSQVAPADYRDWREQATVFTDIALARDIGNFNLTGQGEPERLAVARISPHLLSVLGVEPLLGRRFLEGEDQPGRTNVVLLSHAFWMRRFSGDPGVVGRDLQMNDTPRTVVGVLPPDFAYPQGAFDVWAPLTVNPADFPTRSGSMHLAVARLKPGVTLSQARAELDAIAQRLGRDFPSTNADRRVTIEPLGGDLVRTTRGPLLALLGAVGCLWLIACANLANLVFARTMARQRELQVRVALGATRGRMARQMIAEFIPLLVAAGALGLGLARSGVQLLAARLPTEFPRAKEIALHPSAVAFALASLAVVALAAVLWPAWNASRGELFANLRTRSGGGSAQARLRDGLLLSQIALTALLVTGAVLLTRTFVALEAVDPGFRPEGALTMRMAISRTKYRSDPAIAQYTRQILERVRHVPGILAAGTINRLPIGGIVETWGVDIERTGGEVTRLATANVCIVSPAYLAAMGIPQVRGRDFSEADRAGAPRVAIVDERIAQHYWPGEDAVGKRFHLDVEGVGWIEIVGVAGHVRMEAIDTDLRPQIYLPHDQWPRDRAALVVRTAAKPAAFAPAVIAALHTVDPDQAVYAVDEMREVVRDSLAQRRLTTSLIALFAVASLAVAGVGVFGVFAFVVNQRTREFGVRLALGAQRADILRIVLRRALLIAGAGVAAGLLASAACARLVGGFLFEISALDPLSFGMAGALLLLAALVACWWPARRAARVDPMIALRCE